MCFWFFLITHFTFLKQVPYSMIIIHFNLCVTKSDMQRTEQVVILSINKIINPKSFFFLQILSPHHSIPFTWGSRRKTFFRFESIVHGWLAMGVEQTGSSCRGHRVSRHVGSSPTLVGHGLHRLCCHFLHGGVVFLIKP